LDGRHLRYVELRANGSHLVTIIQFIIMLVSGRQPNERLADFGTTLGIWIAKAARYQTAASEMRPWPWSEVD